MKFVWGLLALGIGIVAVATIRPDAVSAVVPVALSVPFAQVIALRTWLAIVFVVAAVFFFIVALVRFRLLRRGRIAGVLGLVLLTVGAIHGAMVFDRGLSNPGRLGPDSGYTAGGAGDGSITVLTYNTLGGETTMNDLVDVIATNGVDVVALPETSSVRGEELTALLTERGLNFQRFDTGTDQYDAEFSSTVLLVSAALGEYRPGGTTPDGVSSVTVIPASGEGPVVTAVHPIAPLPELMDDWQAQIDAVYSLCLVSETTIIAGDFNSTVDHERLLGHDCADGAREAGTAGLGTWPTDLPNLLGSPIDRVLHTGSQFAGSEAALVEVGDSDHRGLLVRLSPVRS